MLIERKWGRPLVCDDAAVEETALFARLAPADKRRVIEALQARGHVVGFLGDGINDAPALRAADVGILVDTAVDVAKESADAILLEKSLLVLDEGVVEGRKVFANIQKYIRMGASSNFGNMFSVLGASAFLPFVPMAPLQLLANNLLYDVSQVPIPTDKVDPEQVAKPQQWSLGRLSRFILLFGPCSSVFDYATFLVLLYTVGLTAVADREPMTAVLTRLLDQVAAARVPVRVVLLDKAFVSIAVMRLLQARRRPFVIPAVIRGRKPRPGVPAAGLRAVRRRPAGRYAYTHEDRGASARVTVVVAHKTYRHHRTGRRHTRKLLYATWRVGGGPVAVRDLYRRRFGIESSYRQLGEARPRTSSRDGVVRLFWVALGLLVRNAWVWACRAEPRGWSLAAARFILLLDIPVTFTRRDTEDRPPPPT